MRVSSRRHSGNSGGFSSRDEAPTLGSNQLSTQDLVQVAIHDSNGITVRTANMGKHPFCDGSQRWEGKGGDSSSLPAGIYSFSVNVLPADDSGMNGTPLITAL